METKITVYRHRAEIRFKVRHGPWKVRLFRTNSAGNGLLSMTPDGEWVEHRAGMTDASGTLFDRWSVDNVVAARQLAMRLGFEGCVAIDGDEGRTPWWKPKSKVAA